MVERAWSILGLADGSGSLIIHVGEDSVRAPHGSDEARHEQFAYAEPQHGKRVRLKSIV